jgi:hypothetical protein
LRHDGEILHDEKNLVKKRDTLAGFQAHPVRSRRPLADPASFYRNPVTMQDDPRLLDRKTLLLTFLYKFACHEYVGISAAWGRTERPAIARAPRSTDVKVIDAIARILKIEGAEFLSAYPATPLIEAAAKAEIRPVLCRQERVGVGIADGYARVKNGKKLAAFCMQYGPGAENAFPGVATAYSDSTPMLLLPLGHQRDRAQVFPLFSSARTFASVTKSVETITVGSQVADVVRRAISLMRMGRPGPAMVEIPADVVGEEVPEALIDAYRPVKVTAAGANAREVEAAARVLREAKRPVIHAGQGVLYAEASDGPDRAGRAAPGAGHGHPRRQERFPRGSSALPRDGRPGGDRPHLAVSPRGRRGLRHRVQLHPSRNGHHYPSGQDAHSRCGIAPATFRVRVWEVMSRERGHEWVPAAGGR